MTRHVSLSWYVLSNAPVQTISKCTVLFLSKHAYFVTVLLGGHFDLLQAGGLDSLILNSLYDDGAYRASQQPAYGAPAPNPFEVSDPFAMPSNVPNPTVQMPPVLQHQINPFIPFQPAYPQPQQQQNLFNPPNPFGDAGFGAFPPAPTPAPAPAPLPAHPQTTNPFGSTDFL